MEFSVDDGASRAWAAVGHWDTTVCSYSRSSLRATRFTHPRNARFMVDEGSELYYDPTPLREYEKEGRSSPDHTADRAERADMPPPDHPSALDSPQLRRPHMPHTPQQSHSVPFSPRHPSQFQGGMGSPFSNSMPVTPTQFYGNGEQQIRMGNVGGMGIHMDGMMMGGMQGMNIPIGMGSPDPRRMSRRGMGPMDDNFVGMH